MTIETFKLDNGEEFKFDSNSQEFQNSLTAANSMPIHRNDDRFFFARNLEYARQTVFTAPSSDLQLLNSDILPMNTSIAPGFETHTYTVREKLGKAKMISDFADDIPSVEITGREVTGNIRSLATSYIYSYQDMEKDKLNGILSPSVIASKALAARQAIDEKLHDILCFGDLEYNITGMFNNPYVPMSAVAPTGTGSSTQWKDKSAKQILDDIKQARIDMIDLTNGKEKPTHIILDDTSNEYLLNELDTTTYRFRTVKEYIKAVYQIEVIVVSEVKNKFKDGSSAFVLYNKQPNKLEGIVPQRLLPMSPQVNNLATKVILHARTGGVAVFYPFSMSYNYGI